MQWNRCRKKIEHLSFHLQLLLLQEVASLFFFIAIQKPFVLTTSCEFNLEYFSFVLRDQNFVKLRFMNNTFIKILKIILIKFIDLNKQQIINFLKKAMLVTSRKFFLPSFQAEILLAQAKVGRQSFIVDVFLIEYNYNKTVQYCTVQLY